MQKQPVTVAFGRPWDLHLVKPAFFPLPASVVFGRRVADGQMSGPLDDVPEVWSGRFASANPTLVEASSSISRVIGEPPGRPQQSSLYAARFTQGATVVPRALFMVEPGSASPLGVGAGRRAVRSCRSRHEKLPWRNIDSLHGVVEEQFIRPLYTGDTVLPFRCLSPRQAVVPWDGQHLLSGQDDRLDLYPGLARWWRMAEAVWAQNRSNDQLALIEQLDFRRKFSQQFPAADHRIVYTASGMYLAAVVVSDPTAVIEHQVYWGSADSLDEARFLAAIFNSTALTMAVRPLQARGEHNPRHFDKYIFQLPIPLYDCNDTAHKQLVAYAIRSEQLVAGLDLPTSRFQAQRRWIREALAEDGVLADTDAIVKTLLA